MESIQKESYNLNTKEFTNHQRLKGLYYSAGDIFFSKNEEIKKETSPNLPSEFALFNNKLVRYDDNKECQKTLHPLFYKQKY